jgi:hypothetical protein
LQSFTTRTFLSTVSRRVVLLEGKMTRIPTTLPPPYTVSGTLAGSVRWVCKQGMDHLL